ncbi:conserved hypothetical protein [Clostridiaceae bacterium BL-3]|nr:conserved hypothetical protein [Clostridiaceae bacterium BL-3]
MKNIKILFCLLLCIFSFQYYVKAYGSSVGSLSFPKNIVLNEKKADLFKYILDDTHSSPEECNVMAVFSTDEQGEKVVNRIFQNLLEYEKLDKKVLRNNGLYSIEFGHSYINGYIESVQYENHNIITVNVVEKCDDYELPYLKNMVEECLSNVGEKCQYYQYVKAKVQMGNVTTVNRKLEDTLKNIGTSNIKTVPLNQGYSSTAYTHMFDPIQSNGDLIDFNYSVVKYSTGIYIIMGTPEIMTTY